MTPVITYLSTCHLYTHMIHICDEEKHTHTQKMRDTMPCGVWKYDYNTEKKKKRNIKLTVCHNPSDEFSHFSFYLSIDKCRHALILHETKFKSS